MSAGREASSRSWPLRAVGVAAAAALAVAAVGGTLTRIGPWYRALKKPAWTPPDPAFGAIWTLIFALTALAAVLAWREARRFVTREWLIGLFALNGFLNILWSLLFFALQRPDWALWESAALWLSVAVLGVFCWPLSKRASALLAPYLAWVSVACLLNFEVVPAQRAVRVSLEAFFTSGHAVDVVLLVVALELAWLSRRPGRDRRRSAALDRVLALAPGVWLLLALRAALTGAGWPWVATLLAASFPFHLWDVARRRL